MRKIFSVGITCFFLSGCAMASASVLPQVWGALIVAGAVTTAVDTVISGPSENEVDIDNIDSHSDLSIDGCAEPKVSILSPQDSYVSNSKNIKVVFGSENIEINPAGSSKVPDNKCFVSGHHHLLVDGEALPSLFIPFDETHMHFGAGQTEAIIELEPGMHTLQLMLGSSTHGVQVPFGGMDIGPIVSEKITIEVISSE
ncbi:DUF4399 domain-containing protein [Gammaproteobacteria bacterium]|jgi:hypothetical protein|nr:DUF4399 domain-containing protein [Gammaproteobacteria bacterium]MDC0367499.1 DUF4399 domain-containing protein [Gammaproteobacteria bacterium]MDC3301641.1 DUF4399 domain-containing protein [Gammaproteobacteria bacterium]